MRSVTRHVRRTTATRAVAAFATASVCVLFAYACAVPFTPDEVALRPASLAAASDETFSAMVGTTIHNEPIVVVRDNYDEPLPGQSVTFTASAGPQPVPSTIVTDDDGRASPSTWELSHTSGTVTLTASVPGLSSTRQFVVTLNPGPPAQAGVAPANATDPATNNQTASVGAAVLHAPRVKVSDQYGNAVPNVSVTFAVTGGGGAVMPTTPVQTNTAGIAQPVSWTLGTTVGGNSLHAAVQGITSPVAFTATAVAGPATSIVASQSATTAPANSVITVTATVRDAFGNPVTAAPVTFATSGTTGAAVTSANPATTNASGVATASWRLDTLARSNGLTASVGSGASAVSASFTATSTALAASKLAIVAGNGQTTPASTQVPIAPSVVVTDQYNNPVTGQSVTFAPASGSGTVSVTTPACSGASCTVLSGSNGLAAVSSWTIGSASGTHTLHATLAGTTASVSFVATAGTSCTPGPYTLGSSVTHNVTTGDCVYSGNGGYGHEYPMQFATQQYFSLSMTANAPGAGVGIDFWPEFGPVGLDYGYTHLPTTYNIVGAGSHRIRVFGQPGETFTYTLSSQVNPTPPDSECRFQITKGGSHTHTLNAAHCLYSSTNNESGRQRSSRYYVILLGAGSSMTIRMSGTTLDHYIEVLDATNGSNNATYAASVNAGGVGVTEVLTFNAGPQRNYFVIRATHFVSASIGPQSGTYTLTIDP